MHYKRSSNKQHAKRKRCRRSIGIRQTFCETKVKSKLWNHINRLAFWSDKLVSTRRTWRAKVAAGQMVYCTPTTVAAAAANTTRLAAKDGGQNCRLQPAATRQMGDKTCGTDCRNGSRASPHWKAHTPPPQWKWTRSTKTTCRAAV